MKTVLAALFAVAFVATPALACGFGKTAEHKMPTSTAAANDVVKEEAITTYDPAKVPVFEDETEATDEPADEITPVIE